MIAPTLTKDEADAHSVFTALMWALGHPGCEQRLPTGGLRAFEAIGAALIDLETSFYTPDGALAHALARTGARLAPIDAAHYQFYPELTVHDLDPLHAAPVGSYAYPDESASLLIGCRLGSGLNLTLRGPGIQGSSTLRIAGLPEGFWPLRKNAIRYPLGWDMWLIDGDRIVGLPRTTVIEGYGYGIRCSARRGAGHPGGRAALPSAERRP
ncbi:phosphonate C-P lyase system protein PhnH [Candidatus Gracilibacteria bacterium]|nr:phosphonate C-P lyase system protein PhnH [Candidatus Gracilibacteria bacterium]